MIQPLVTSFLADAIRIAECVDRIAPTERMLNEFIADFHEIGSPPGHDNLQRVRARESESKRASAHLSSRSRAYLSSRSVPSLKTSPAGSQPRLLAPRTFGCLNSPSHRHISVESPFP